MPVAVLPEPRSLLDAQRQAGPGRRRQAPRPAIPRPLRPRRGRGATSRADRPAVPARDEARGRGASQAMTDALEVCTGPAMRAVRDLIAKVATTNATVLLTGE